MHPIPESFAADAFVGRSLEMICCTETTTAFHFGSDLFVNAFDSYDWCSSEGGKNETMAHPLSAVGPLAVLGSEVAQVTVGNARRTFRIQFAGGAAIEFRSQHAYESFEVMMQGTRLIM